MLRAYYDTERVTAGITPGKKIRRPNQVATLDGPHGSMSLCRSRNLNEPFGEVAFLFSPVEAHVRHKRWRVDNPLHSSR